MQCMMNYRCRSRNKKVNEGLMSDEIKLFEGNKIRSVWDNEKEEWYFSVVDVVGALTGSPNPRDYWYRVKKRMSEEERSQLSTICRQLKLEAADGKKYNTDAAERQKLHRRVRMINLSLIIEADGIRSLRITN